MIYSHLPLKICFSETTSNQKELFGLYLTSVRDRGLGQSRPCSQLHPVTWQPWKEGSQLPLQRQHLLESSQTLPCSALNPCLPHLLSRLPCCLLLSPHHGFKSFLFFGVWRLSGLGPSLQLHPWLLRLELFLPCYCPPPQTLSPPSLPCYAPFRASTPQDSFCKCF